MAPDIEEDGTLLPEQQIISMLQGLFEEQEKEEERLTGLLQDVQKKRKRYKRALDDLAGARDETQKSKRASGKSGHDWNISEEKLQEVWTRINELVGPEDKFTGTDIGKQSPGLSSEAIRRAMVVLRERELLRKAGTGRGGSTFYALMPNAAEANNGN